MSVSFDCNTLDFKRPLGFKPSVYVRVSNAHKSYPVAFKFSVNESRGYCVRPNMGRIAPGDNVRVQIMMSDGKQRPENPSKTKFRIQSAYVLPARAALGDVPKILEAAKTDSAGDKVAEAERKLYTNKLRVQVLDADPSDSSDEAPTSAARAVTDSPEETPAKCWSGFRFWRKSQHSSSMSTAATRTTVSPASTAAPSSPAVTSEKEKILSMESAISGSYHTFSTCCSSGMHAPGADIWTLDAPLPAYSAAGADDVYRPEVMDTIEATVEKYDSALRELSLDLLAHPEIMFQEHHAHDVLSDFMQKHGFDVTRHYKMPTAWRAEFTHAPAKASAEEMARRTVRTLGVNAEMDALPGIGHACGHNLIAISGVGVALAVKAALEKHDVPGTVVLLGTPAEEGGQGKATLLKKGAYKGMDACVMSHPGPGPANVAMLGPSLALEGMEVEFTGHTAHASAAPWEGTNALDAFVLTYTSVSALRQQIKPDHRVHGVIKGPGNLAANVIPEYTKSLWYVRAPTYKELEILRERVMNCVKAAALATGCKYKITHDQPAMDLRQNVTLSNEFVSILKNRYGVESAAGEGAIGGSTDFGNVTYEVPAIHPAYSIPTMPNGGNHTALFTKAASTPEAHTATLVVTKALALAGFRVLDDETYAKKVKKSFEDGEKLLL